MSYLNNQDEDAIAQRLSALPYGVAITIEGSPDDHYFAETLDLISYLTALNPEKVSYTFRVKSSGVKVAMHSDETPDLDIAFWGVPSGLEFTSLMDAISLYGGMPSEIDSMTLDLLDQLATSVTASIFVTPT
ncbi:MAG: hypothetical protein ACYCT0_03085 [Sulfobacillus sp.]